VLEFLGQEMVKAALNAERSLTQTSGGVGSYNIGEIHQAASALTSQMIALQVLFYLNKFFMPGFSLYNRGEGGPPIWLKIQSIDQQERQLIMQLLGVAGNSEGGQEFFNMIDWRTIASTSNIAILDEAEIKRMKEERHQEAMSNQEDQMQIASKFQSPAPAKLRPGEKLAPSDGQKKVSANALPKKLEEAIALLANGQVGLPFILGEHEAEVLYQAGVLDEEVYQLFNPWHSRADGRFTSGPGGAGGSASSDSQETKQAVTTKAKKGGGIIKTTGKVLGLAGLGLISLAVISNLGDSSDFQPPPRPGEEPRPGESEEDRRRRLIEEKTRELNELTNGWPSFNDEQEALAFGVARLREMGLDGIPDNIAIRIQDFPGPHSGLYQGKGTGKEGNVFLMKPELRDGLLMGNPDAMAVMLHEIAHSNQEDDIDLGGFGTEIDLNNINEIGANANNFSTYFEGQNDLVSQMALSRIYGQPMGVNDHFRVGEERNRLHNELNQLDGGNRPIVDVGAYGYDQTGIWAGLARAHEQSRGQSAINFAIDSHRSGFNYGAQHALLVELFPEQMKTYSRNFGLNKDFPAMSTIEGWLASQYGIDSGTSLQAMLQEAARQ